MSLTPPFLLLDRYEVAAEIGRGGHAIVYRAHDRVFDRAVAIKLLRDETLSPDVLARFRQEIQLTARLEHAHILHIYDTGTFEGLPYVVMELASGQTLADRLAREPQLPIVDALQIARDVGLALAHAHTRGIVHRDVKPENILLGSGGAMLADFGVARVTADQVVQRITSTGMAVGTLQYMSPEQLCAEPIVDERSDQYALACVLYEMLAGVRPHTSASLEGLRMLRLTGQHAPVSAHRPSVPAEIEEALQIAMAVAPADRFRHMDEFLAALGVVPTGDMAVSRAPSGGVRRAGARSGGGTPALLAAPATTPMSRGRRWGIGLGLVGVVAAAVLWQGSRSATSSGAATGLPEAGTLTVSLAPVDKGADSLDVAFRERVMAELSAWPGVEVQETSSTQARRLTSIATAVGGAVQLRLDVRSNETAAWSIVRDVPASVTEWSSVVASMVREALSGRPASEVPELALLSERSLPALLAYARGFAILRDSGDLNSAAQAFRKARDASPAFAPAYFWAAQTASWVPSNAPEVWRTDAEQAVRLGTMRGVDSLLAVGLRHLAAQAYPEACATYRAAVERDPTSFVGWYGLGQCQYEDRVVSERNGRAQFRSSHWGASTAYRKAVEFAETSAWLGAMFPRMRRATYSGGSELRSGVGASTRGTYIALPSLDSDTLAFLPITEPQSGNPASVPTTWRSAIRRGQRLREELTRQWVTRFPGAPHAWLEHSLSLELSGQIDPRAAWSAQAALDSIGARPLSPELSARLAVARTRLAVRRGDTADALRIARRTLSGTVSASREVAAILLPLAAFTGDSAKVNALFQPDESMRAALPTVVADTLEALQRATLLGQCGELRRLHESLEHVMSTSIADPELEPQRQRWLPRTYFAAVPCVGAQLLAKLTPRVPLDSAIQALAQDDTARTRRILNDLPRRRRGATAGTLTWDYQVIEVWALAQVGDTAEAVKRLTDALTDIASMSLSTFEQAEQASGLRQGWRLLQDLRETAIKKRRTANPSR